MELGQAPMLLVFLSPRQALPSHLHIIEFKLYNNGFFCTRRKSLFHIDRDEWVQTRTRGKLHHTQTPALDRSAMWNKLYEFKKALVLMLRGSGPYASWLYACWDDE